MQWYKGRLCCINTQEIAVSCGGDLYTTTKVALAILHSTADYSTTAAQILTLFTRGFWAQHHLSNGIRYVSVPSTVRKSLSSVQGVLGINLVIFYSTADYSTTAQSILNQFTESCWARCQLPNGIR